MELTPFSTAVASSESTNFNRSDSKQGCLEGLLGSWLNSIFVLIGPKSNDSNELSCSFCNHFCSNFVFLSCITFTPTPVFNQAVCFFAGFMCFDTIFSWVSFLCTCHFPVLIASFLGLHLIAMISVLHHTVLQSISSSQSHLCQSFFISLYQKFHFATFVFTFFHICTHKVCKANNFNSL